MILDTYFRSVVEQTLLLCCGDDYHCDRYVKNDNLTFLNYVASVVKDTDFNFSMFRYMLEERQFKQIILVVHNDCPAMDAIYEEEPEGLNNVTEMLVLSKDQQKILLKRRATDHLKNQLLSLSTSIGMRALKNEFDFKLKGLLIDEFDFLKITEFEVNDDGTLGITKFSR